MRIKQTELRIANQEKETEILGFRENLENDEYKKRNDNEEGEEPDVDISHINTLNQLPVSRRSPCVSDLKSTSTPPHRYRPTCACGSGNGLKEAVKEL